MSYLDRPETVWEVERDVWRAEVDWDGEPNVVIVGSARGAALTKWETTPMPVDIVADDDVRELWGTAWLHR